MARTRRRLTPAPTAAEPAPEALASLGLPIGVLDKTRALATRAAAAARLAHEAQVREAVTRTELTLALHGSLAARAELEGRLREQALAAYRARGPGRLRRHNRPSRILDKVLARLGSLGQALVIARSGVWQGTGRPLHDVRHMAAYARRRANPDVVPLTPFDQAWYLATYPDVAIRRMAPLVHYLVDGAREGRSPSPMFHAAFYAADNAHELAATGVSGLEHYVRAGAAAGRSPHPLFDTGHYLAQAPVLAPGDDPLSHYLREGWALGLSPHPLFDPAWYVQQAPEAATQPGLSHYLAVGSRTGLSPHPLFDAPWYLDQNPAAAESGLEPLIHFLMVGAAEGRSPSPWFDLPHYVAERGEALPVGVNPLVDYLRGGAWAVAEPRPGFPTAAYLASRPELARGLTPLEHWARRAGR